MINKLQSIIHFLQQAEKLKSTLRTAWTESGRQESTAEHTWRLSLLAMLLTDEYPQLDSLKILKLCIIHDLAEAVSGDIPAPLQHRVSNKSELEKQDLLILIAPLKAAQREELLTLWTEYDQMSTDEARLVKALDKIETMLQHNQGQNPSDFDYAFNLTYGQKHTGYDDLTTQLRQLVDVDTLQHVKGSMG
ncbi:HD domain-containing protein [Vibrio tubiashii]|uniref:HD domain-containing protein n=1 Tax=Vibrio tubiashii TaxID=29498 RepID=UPI00234E864A|nr:HD domain-containing protein [Vibrio tubiashii]WCP68992.1 HD domain-containing protein [Vibrio tubiashii]